jgi:chromosome segregation ATPase
MQNQDALIKLKYLKTIKTPAIAQFEHRLQEIKMLIYERLRTTVEEENQNQDQLSLIIAKEQKTSGEVKLLKVELEKAKKERQGEINKKNEIIRKLKDELKDIKTQAEEVTRKLETRSKMKEEQDLKSSKERVSKSSKSGK